MKPIKLRSNKARNKGGRSSGGTRYFQGKLKGEREIVRFMNSIRKKKNFSIDELIYALKFMDKKAKRIAEQVEKYCFHLR